MFDLITVAVPDFKPKMVHVDFELAITNALKNYFPNTIIYRCYYHLTQSLWKKAKMIDGRARAKTVKSKILRRLVGLCCILPLLPIDMVSKGWSYINEEYHEINDKKVNTFIKYFANFYLKEKNIKEWCVYNRRHRTNNVSESWNAGIHKKVNKNYVTIAKVMTKIYLTPKSKLNDSRDTHYKLRDNQILQAQMQLIHEEISVGHFLEKLR